MYETSPQAEARDEMQECIEECLDCRRTCFQTAMDYCLEMGGEHIAPEHFRLLMNCGEICQTAADFMISKSPLHVGVCDVCAEVCDACAESCEEIGNMDECIQACESCAESCRQMTGSFESLSSRPPTGQDRAAAPPAS